MFQAHRPQGGLLQKRHPLNAFQHFKGPNLQAAFFMAMKSACSKVPVKHHHIDFIPNSHVSLGMPQHDQAVGLHHGAEHA